MQRQQRQSQSRWPAPQQSSSALSVRALPQKLQLVASCDAAQLHCEKMLVPQNMHERIVHTHEPSAAPSPGAGGLCGARIAVPPQSSQLGGQLLHRPALTAQSLSLFSGLPARGRLLLLCELPLQDARPTDAYTAPLSKPGMASSFPEPKPVIRNGACPADA